MSIRGFKNTLTVPAGTASGAPVSQALEVAPGRAVSFRLIVPPGPRGEVEFWLEHQGAQVVPHPPERWDNLDDDLVEQPLHREVPTGEQTFTLYAISPDANFEHTVTFEVLVDTAGVAGTPASPAGLTDRLLGVLGMGG